MSKEKYKTDLRTSVLSHVKYAEKSLALLETLAVAYNHVPSDIKDAFLKIKSFFVEKELDAYRNLLLILNMIDDAEDKEATKMAFKRFLAADMSIMHFWSHNGERPGTWLDKDEKKMRALFREVKRELYGKHKPAGPKKKVKKENQQNKEEGE